MSTTGKDVIYIDIDDEITTIIDKVQQSKKSIIALMLPKRASVLQSIVNMKLLRRTADSHKKKLVLITTDKSLLPLAGAVGLYTAATLQSKPEIPSAPEVHNSEELITDTGVDVTAENIDPSKTVGELSGMAPASAIEMTASDSDEAIEVDNTEPRAPAETIKKSPKKSLKVPDFIMFRKKFFLAAGAAVLLLIGWFVVFGVLPRATVRIVTDTSSVTSTMTPVMNVKATEVDLEKETIPAVRQEFEDAQTVKVDATGEKDMGTKASGTVRIFNCNQIDKLGDISRTIPAGTGVSVGDLTYIMQESATVQPSGFTGSGCKYDKPSESVKVTAQDAGERYNISARDNHEYSVAGYSSMSANGSQMSGGTTKVVKIITEKDVDAAKAKLVSDKTDEVKDELKTRLENEGFYAVTATFEEPDAELTVAPQVGAEASEVTVASKTVYSMFGVKKDDLIKLITHDVKDSVDTDRQVILDSGLDKASFRIDSRRSKDIVTVTIQTVVTAGPDIDTEELRQQVAGKKRGEIQSMLGDIPDVKDVNVEYSPFWVYSTPKSANKINIVVEESK